ncbi:IclR family transcriptional regulator [Oricola nitratireducens]|uniref:IclR family transcriptional regulator n=1 Tax=Oricola nitratireducens TaxID=2775868 RepID=UPI001866DF35|nr:IclR family transcriptional regulator [Oricola nitratireducens]
MAARNSLERVIALLDVFTEDHLEWTPEEMMAELGYSRPTLYRYLKTLKEAGFLTSMPSGGFTLGPRVVEMDFLMRKSDPLVCYAQPHLEALAAMWPCNSLIVRWYGNKLLCVASESSTADVETSYPRGRPMPLARGAISRAIIAFLPRRKLLPVVDANLTDLAEVGLGNDRDAVLESLRQVRRAGYAVAYGEVTPGVAGIAAPVFDGGTSPIASLCVTIAREVADSHGVDAIGRRVAEYAGEVSARLSRDRTAAESEAARNA